MNQIIWTEHQQAGTYVAYCGAQHVATLHPRYLRQWDARPHGYSVQVGIFPNIRTYTINGDLTKAQEFAAAKFAA